MRVKVHRPTPCGCPCGGKDQWHSMVYLRVVREVTDIYGHVMLPMSKTLVRVDRKRLPNYTFGPWIIAMSTIKYKYKNKHLTDSNRFWRS